jgi:site-specific DNA recombinase
MIVATKSKRSTTTKLIPAVAYIRMSTDQQEDSPERQRAEITAMAEKGGYEVLKWYEDHGLTGTKSKNRPQFQKLLNDAQMGGFSAILMHEQSRFGRETALQFASHLNVLNECGVSLVTRKGKVDPNDIGGFITTMVEQFGNRAENIAHRGTSGKRRKVLNGVWMGHSPFGYDRSILDANGKEITRVRHGEPFCRSSSHGCRLMPSTDPKVIKAIRNVFRDYLDGKSLKEIAIALNATGCRTKFGNKFKIGNIARMAKNPAYYGAHVVGRATRGVGRMGEFSRIFESETIVNEKAHEGIISKQTFDAVQCIAATRPGWHYKGSEQRYLLSGIVICGHCGSKIYGHHGTVLDRKNDRRIPKIGYQCQNGSKSVEPDQKNCIRIDGNTLEEAVLDVIRTHVLTEDNLKRCEAMHRASLENKSTLKADRLVRELQRKIDQASKNLALADDPSDFTAISKQLREWRKELKKMGDAKVTPRVRSPLQGLGIEDMKSCRDFLKKADRGKLSDAIHQVIESVVISRVEPRTIKTTARVSFHPESYSGPSIEIPAESLRARNGGRTRIPAIVASFGRPVGVSDVIKATGLAEATVVWYLGQLVRDKLLSKTPEGWVCSR